ncbi:hypothetical protein GIB67_037792 [Kingdonia uniflora]|uniref:Uncharacterized protein n=1 Tax=Kingdonia uniflora TaxID=39325 RepID=A0A7J7LVC7_9MAGN|nr:hypothetical protein GIB67_037792 [Kingdonia uniflora]
MRCEVHLGTEVQLTNYNPDVLDESVLWTESKDLGDGYRCIRMVNNIRLNLDAFNGDKNHGGVHDGTTAVLWEWKKGDNQRWKISPYCILTITDVLAICLYQAYKRPPSKKRISVWKLLLLEVVGYDKKIWLWRLSVSDMCFVFLTCHVFE